MRAVETTPTFLFISLACDHEWENIDGLSIKWFARCAFTEAFCLGWIVLCLHKTHSRGDMVVALRLLLEPKLSSSNVVLEILIRRLAYKCVLSSRQISRLLSTQIHLTTEKLRANSHDRGGCLTVCKHTLRSTFASCAVFYSYRWFYTRCH